MPVLDFQSMTLPVLKILSDGQPHSRKDVAKELAKVLEPPSRRTHRRTVGTGPGNKPVEHVKIGTLRLTWMIDQTSCLSECKSGEFGWQLCHLVSDVLRDPAGIKIS